MMRMVRNLRPTMVAAGLVILGFMTPWAWADSSAAPPTLAVLEFSLSLDIANPDDATQDGLPAQLASDTLRRLASRSERYELADGGARVAGSTCTNTDCALQLGRELGVERVILGSDYQGQRPDLVRVRPPRERLRRDNLARRDPAIQRQRD